jgi:hypothetical protein
MKNTPRNLITSSRIAALALLLLTNTFMPAFAQDRDKIWTAAASTGTVDEADYNDVVFTEPVATLALASVRGVIRYNVTAVDGLFGTLTSTSYPDVVVRYRDPGANARVIVRLKEHILANSNAALIGQINTLATFDSNLHPQAPGFQTRTFGNCATFKELDFGGPFNVRVYFIEVELSKTDSQGNPGLSGLAITRYGVCP